MPHTPDADLPANPMVDTRLEALTQWLAPHVPSAQTIMPASADASFRRYFRVTDVHGASTIVMDAPPEKEDCAPFVRIAQMMTDAGNVAPKVLAADLTQGFLLLSDLGHETMLDVLPRASAGNLERLFADARAALIRWQAASAPDVLPAYDRTLLQRELDLFPEWFVGRHLGRTFTPAQQAIWQNTCDRLIDRALAQSKVFVHRDFMPRNLMVSTQAEPSRLGVLDFQDAAYGPISYDIISLYRDAFWSWEEDIVLDGIIRYWEAAKKAGLPMPDQFAEFYHDCEWMGMQRHLKVMGIFARIHYRDGKPKYLTDAPRFARYVRDVARRYEGLGPFARMFDELVGSPN